MTAAPNYAPLLEVRECLLEHLVALDLAGDRWFRSPDVLMSEINCLCHYDTLGQAITGLDRQGALEHHLVSDDVAELHGNADEDVYRAEWRLNANWLSPAATAPGPRGRVSALAARAV